MTAPTDAERAREIVWTMRSGHQCADIRCGACAEFISAALAAVRAEEQEACAAEFERKARAVPINGTINFNGFAQSEFNLLMWAARAIRRREG